MSWRVQHTVHASVCVLCQCGVCRAAKPSAVLQLPAPAAAVARNVTVALLWLPHLVLCSGSFATVKAATRKADGTKWAVKIIAKQSLGPEDEEALVAAAGG